MANFSTLWTNLALLGLLVFGLFAIGITLHTSNPTNQSILNSALVNQTYSNLNSSLSDLQSSTQAQKSNFESENPTVGFGSLILFTVVSAGKVFNGLIITIYNVLIKYPSVTLGLSPVIVGVIGAILLVLIVLGLWGVYKLGG